MDSTTKDLKTSACALGDSKDDPMESPQTHGEKSACGKVEKSISEKERSCQDPSLDGEGAAVCDKLLKDQSDHSVISKTDAKTETILQIDLVESIEKSEMDSENKETSNLKLGDSSQSKKVGPALVEPCHISCSSEDRNPSSSPKPIPASAENDSNQLSENNNDNLSENIDNSVPVSRPSPPVPETRPDLSSSEHAENIEFKNFSDSSAGGNDSNKGIESTSTVSVNEETISACDGPTPISPKETNAAVAALISDDSAPEASNEEELPTCMELGDDPIVNEQEGKVKEAIMNVDDNDIGLKIVSVQSQYDSPRDGGTLSSKQSENESDVNTSSSIIISSADCEETSKPNSTSGVENKTVSLRPLSEAVVIENESLNAENMTEMTAENHQTEQSISTSSLPAPHRKVTSSEASKLSEESKVINEIPVDRKSEAKDKPIHEADGDEEVCIVPDTEPRVPSDKEKADAVEKANKVLSSVEGEISESNSGKNCNAQKHSTGTLASEVIPMSTDVSVDENKPHDSSNRKFGIQLVSTSSLVSRQESPRAEERTQDVLECFNVQDDLLQTGEYEDKACVVCSKTVKCKYHLKTEGGIFICEDDCYNSYKKANEAHVPKIRPRKLDNTYVHKCGQCSKAVDPKLEKSLGWETMDFCSEECLEKYQMTLGSHCANCKGSVQAASLGKYCVRFGYDMKQFCTAHCLEDFKKGLKVCSYCQKDISRGAEGFLAPVGDKGQFKDFCTQECMEKYDQMSHNSSPPEVTHECAVCNELKTVRVEVLLDSKVQKLCSEPCFAAFKFVNNIIADKCDMCKKYYDHNRSENFTVFYDDSPHSFCCKTCMNVYILAKRKIVPCSWCKVKKYNFDMIKKSVKSGQAPFVFCSLHCLKSFQVSQASSVPSKKVTCESCNSTSPSQYHLTMSDATTRSFCSPNCVMNFQAKFSKTAVPVQTDRSPYPLGQPRRIAAKKISSINVSVAEKDHDSTNTPGSLPVISSVTSLAHTAGPVKQTSPAPPIPTGAATNQSSETVKTVYKQHLIVRPPVHPAMANCAVQVKPKSLTKSVSCHPQTSTTGTQTDDSMVKPFFIPVPVPIFIPAPMRMYSSPYPVPVPITLPIPVPIFIPTTKNSADGILKEIKRIQEKIPSDPFEAELLMMAEMVASEKKGESTDSDSEGGTASQNADANDPGNTAESDSSTENVDTNNTLSDEVLQIALKMASELDEPAVDFETAVVATVVAQTPTSQPLQEKKNESDEGGGSEHSSRSASKRPLRTSSRSSSVNAKRGRKSSSSDQSNIYPLSEPIHIKEEPVEKPDAHMCLKFTLGVNAWKSWVCQKNAEIEKADGSTKKIKTFKPALLELSADELNYSLCLFVKEVRKPNGQEYSPDTIYYLCLGIQQYLMENGRVENIFSDPYYETFTDCLDDLAKQFSPLCPETQCLVTRVEEEHLWESKQLGAHSPYVLLSTLMFFNTKHFNLMTVEEHMQLSFSHIMKHWKRPPSSSISGPNKSGSSRNIVLRFYPPQSALANNSKKKKMYEQDENDDTPLKCPVKLYEFYLSKCPESVKTRNDVFYLLPERSCVPDSPVWYSTMPLGHEQLQKMLHRIKMVKEIIML